MLLLAVDTTSEHGGVALFSDRDCLASVSNAGSSGYSISLFQAVDRALAESGARLLRPALSLHDIELFATANGPGSFTGIRTGLAATQGWATALQRPVVGVSILQAMVHAARPESAWAAAFMDARREEFYVGLFRRSAERTNGVYEAQGEALVTTPQALGGLLQERLNSPATGTCIIRDQDSAAQALRSRLPDELQWLSVSGYLLENIAQLALQACERGEVQTPAELDACYIRRSDAELNWRR